MKKTRKKTKKSLGTAGSPAVAKKSFLQATGKSAKDLGLGLAGFCGGYVGSQLIKTDKPLVNGGIALASLAASAAARKYNWAQKLLLGLGLYFGVKTINGLAVGAVAGLEGMGMAIPDSVKKIIAKVVPSLGDPEEFSGDAELSAAEYEILNGAFGNVDPSLIGEDDEMGRLFSRGNAKKAAKMNAMNMLLPGSGFINAGAKAAMNRNGGRIPVPGCRGIQIPQMNGMGSVAIDASTI